MTASHQAPALRAPTLDDALDELRARGLRASSARRLVLEALFLADEPVSAERIADGLEGKVTRSDLASVYRNLETLEELGLVRHVHLGHAPGLYALAGRRREYLVCESCGTVLAVSSERLAGVRAELRAELGFEASFTHFPIVGRCGACR